MPLVATELRYLHPSTRGVHHCFLKKEQRGAMRLRFCSVACHLRLPGHELHSVLGDFEDIWPRVLRVRELADAPMRSNCGGGLNPLEVAGIQ